MAWGDKVAPNVTDPTDTPFELEGVTEQEFNTIRSFLLTSLTTDDLGNDIIGNEGYFVAARRDVHDELGDDTVDEVSNPDNPQYTQQRNDRYRLAVMLLTAVYMCEAVPELSSESLGPIRRSWDETDWMSKEKKLRTRHQNEMDKITKATAAKPGFVVLNGSRGRFGRRR